MFILSLCMMPDTEESSFDESNFNISETEYDGEHSLCDSNESDKIPTSKRKKGNKTLSDVTGKRCEQLTKSKRQRKRTQHYGKTIPIKYDDLINQLELNRSDRLASAPQLSIETVNLETSGCDRSGRGLQTSFIAENELFSKIQSLHEKIVAAIDERLNSFEKRLLASINLQILRLEATFNTKRMDSTRKRSRLLSLDALPESPPCNDIVFPLKTPEDVSLLEQRLENDDFQKSIFNEFIVINGNNGELDAGKLIRGIFHKFFTKENLGNFTYAGKNKQTRKFKCFTKILGLIFELLQAADSSYTRNEFDRDVVEKVFKYAYQGRRRDSNDVRIMNLTETASSIIQPNVQSNETIPHNGHPTTLKDTNHLQPIQPVPIRQQFDYTNISNNYDPYSTFGSTPNFPSHSYHRSEENIASKENFHQF